MIEMKSIQSIYNDKTETELVTSGKFRRDDESFLISYKDSDATGFKGSETEISVTGNSIASIIRRGSANSDLVIEPGKSITATTPLPTEKWLSVSIPISLKTI